MAETDDGSRRPPLLRTTTGARGTRFIIVVDGALRYRYLDAAVAAATVSVLLSHIVFVKVEFDPRLGGKLCET